MAYKAIMEVQTKQKKEQKGNADRAVDTLFRITASNHITLSDIADKKANILLSVNAIIISLVLSNLVPKLDNPSNQYLIYPTVIFLISAVISMILSIAVTRPRISSGKFTKEDVIQRKVNIVFFGNFHRMQLTEFEWAMREVMKDKEYLHLTLIKDLYYLGKVLAMKYTILRYTYNVFLVGLICSILAFAFAFVYGRS